MRSPPAQVSNETLNGYFPKVPLKTSVIILVTWWQQVLELKKPNPHQTTSKPFVNLKSNLALLYNKCHKFWKRVLTWIIPKTNFFPTVVTLLSRSFYLPRLAKGVISPVPPYSGYFVLSHTHKVDTEDTYYKTYLPYCRPPKLGLASKQ